MTEESATGPLCTRHGHHAVHGMEYERTEVEEEKVSIGGSGEGEGGESQEIDKKKKYFWPPAKARVPRVPREMATPSPEKDVTTWLRSFYGEK